MLKLADIASYRRLTVQDRGTLVAAVLLLAFVVAGLRVIGFRRVQQTLLAIGVTAKSPNAPANLSARATRTAKLVQLAARRGFCRATCLPQALVLHCLLRCQRIQADLKIGVRKAVDRTLEAHAWVEHAGQPLGGDVDSCERFAAFSEPIQSRSQE